jgi:prevent-host-death family protein
LWLHASYNDLVNVALESVGVRDLKNNLSRYLAMVRQGREVVITEHGHPVARVIPIHGNSGHERLAALIARGDITPAKRRARSLPAPVRLPKGATVSDLVKEQRR